MKKSFTYVLPLLVGLILGGCASFFTPSNETTAEVARDLSEQSLYVSSFSFVNQDEEAVTDEDFHGSYWLATMTFTDCPTICNMMTPNMAEIQEASEEQGLELSFVSFTVDPATDTPDVLQTYGEQYNVDFSNWDFLTGYDPNEIEQFVEESFHSTVLNDPADPDIIHTTDFFLINDEGQVVRSYDGLNSNIPPIISDLESVIH
ncbi:SCO family protein [Geomicrobium sp. JSM 1781026]